jgi:hypothetical protein
MAAVAAAQPTADALDVLVAADLVRPSEHAHSFAFRHTVIHRAVYHAIPPARRLDGHRRVADRLARRGDPAPLRAHHVELCATPGDESAIELLANAADEVADTAPAVAAQWWGTALALQRNAPDDLRRELMTARARALAPCGRPEEALEEFDRLGPLTPGAAASASATGRPRGCSRARSRPAGRAARTTCCSSCARRSRWRTTSTCARMRRSPRRRPRRRAPAFRA